MNIFYLSEDPKQAAQMMCDKHVVKMILESAQLLCTAHRELNGTEKLHNSIVDAYYPPQYVDLYKATHLNHPSSIWVREAYANYTWLFHHFIALSEEYYNRYGKRHKTHEKYWWVLGNVPENIRYNNGETTPIRLAMPDQYKIDGDPVASYRAYYIGDKDRIAKWKHGNVPLWYTLGLAEKYRKLWFEEEGYEPSVSDVDMINMYQEKHNYWAKRARKVKS